MKLKIDGGRRQLVKDGIYAETGIYVRAQDEKGKWGNADIVELERDSLLAWLRAHGGDNPMAENVVGILFGHGHLHDHEDEEE